MRKIEKLYKVVAEKINTKWLMLSGIFVYLLTMLPLWYLAFFARPSGDDYGYSKATRVAWKHTHSLIEVFKAGLETTRYMCNVLNGDWFTVFLFTLMPEVFVTWSYWIVPFIMSAFLISSTVLVTRELLGRRLGMSTSAWLLIAALILLASYQYVPSTAIALYWYVGATHYIFPHFLALCLICMASVYQRTGKIRYLVLSAVGFVMIGGSSYFSFLLVFLVYIAMVVLCARENKRIFWLGVPFLAGAVGLYFMVTAPGNWQRGGPDFGFHFTRVVDTIISSMIQSVVCVGEYLRNKTFIFIVLLVIAVLTWEELHRIKTKYPFRLPLLFVGYMYGIYAAMYAPEIYAAVEVSGGPDTMQYLTFILAAVASIVYVEGWVYQKMYKKDRLWKESEVHSRITIPTLGICLVLLLLIRGELKESVLYRSYDYVASGQAADFKEQIASQMEILLDDSIKEAYLCPINDKQGPLMHMPVTTDPENFTNWAVEGFYEKDRVYMLPLEE